MNKPLIRLFAAGFLLLAFAHFAFISSVPGFQNDEAAIAYLTHFIGRRPGFWPVYGISNYAFAGIHYPTSLLFGVFGTHLWVYRAVGALQVLIGIALISAAFWKSGLKKAAALLPWVIGFFPALVINQRWTVELTTFWVTCAGMIAYGISIRKSKGPTLKAYLWISVGVFLGTFSHILFLAPALSLWLCLFCTGKITERKDQLAIGLTGLSLLPIFGLIYKAVPDSEKSKPLQAALLVFTLVLIHLIPEKAFSRLRGVRTFGLMALSSLGSLLIIPLIVFLEGHWLALFSVGFLEQPFLRGTLFIPIFLALFFALRSGWRPRILFYWSFLSISLLATYCMVVKAGPRYLEIPFLVVACGVALLFSKLSGWKLKLVLSLWIAQGALILGFNYFKPSVEERQIATTFRLWRWRDSSEGFLPKLKLMRRLAREGCRFSDLDYNDTIQNQNALFVTLQFLDLGDWPKLDSTYCRLNPPLRLSTTDNPTQTFENPDQSLFQEGVFLIQGASK